VSWRDRGTQPTNFRTHAVQRFHKHLGWLPNGERGSTTGRSCGGEGVEEMNLIHSAGLCEALRGRKTPIPGTDFTAN